ncbi:hypothetical protein B0T10DRAFT_500495 [Thelonectria olida]|uniref:Uncharacterized protein n=1 Tax=Thelonectria olida TaxID=1576542 RepID=A0A9P8VQV4_9HYPO|nr:hypothetical protein B0T10DRAFT_500495 [Thelonectria olida]
MLPILRRSLHTIAPRMALATMTQSSYFPVPPADTQKHHVQTKMNYFKRLEGRKELPTLYPLRPETHYVSQYTESVDVTVYDIGGEELGYNLETHGFKIHCHGTKVTDLSDMDTVKREYFPEVQQILKDA